MPRVAAASRPACTALTNGPGSDATAAVAPSGGQAAAKGGAPRSSFTQPAYPAAHASAAASAAAPAAGAAGSISSAAGGAKERSASSASSAPPGGGYGDAPCSCARCMRRAGPIREDVDERIAQISYILAGVYDDTPNPSELVTREHAKLAHLLMTTVEAGSAPALRALLDKIAADGGAGDDDDDDGEQMTEDICTELLISAAQLGHAEILRLLSSCGADLEERDSKRGGRALMHAAHNGHTAAVKTLLELGADVDAQDDNGYTALMVSIFSDRSAAAEALLLGGADPDLQCDQGRTALGYAAMYGSIDCIHLLAKHGADLGHVDRDGLTPLQLAEDSARQQAVDVLRRLAMKAKMRAEHEERRRSKNAAKGGSVNAAEMKRREAEAAAIAAALLQEEEAEKARQAEAAAAKKAKANKAKGSKQQQQGGGEQAATTTATAAAAGTAPSSAAALRGSSSPEGSGVSSSTAQPGAEGEEAAAPASSSATASGKAGSKKQGGKLKGAAGSASSAGAPANPSVAAGEQDASQPSAGPAAHWLQQMLGPEQPPAAAAAATTPSAAAATGQAAAASTSPSSTTAAAADPAGALRDEWEALLEEAAKCLEEKKQPLLLARIQALLPQCAAAGISVKYGKKVLQRLEAVPPARQALRAAMAAVPVSRAALALALNECKSVRCLLHPGLLQEAEALVDKLGRQEESDRWSRMANALSWQVNGGGAGAGAPVAPLQQPRAPLAPVAVPNSNSLFAHPLPSQQPALGMAGGFGEELECEDMECVVCLAAAKSTCCVPCGHVCMCPACAKDVQQSHACCPVCRAHIDCVLEIL